MQQVIIQGGLTEAEIEGVKVAGKTGTAESGNGEAHSWWITFAPADDPKIRQPVTSPGTSASRKVARPMVARPNGSSGCCSTLATRRHPAAMSSGSWATTAV